MPTPTPHPATPELPDAPDLRDLRDLRDLLDAGAPLSRPTVAGHAVAVYRDQGGIADAVARATTWGLPLIGLLRGGDDDDHAWVRPLARASGVVPHVAVVTGDAGAWPTAARFADAVLAVGRPTDGGAPTAAAQPADLHAATPAEAAALLGDVLDHLPATCLADPPTVAPAPPRLAPDTLRTLVPDVPDLPYDVGALLDAVLDPGGVRLGGRSALVRVLARVEGHPVGVVATDPSHRQGVPAAADARAAARFVSWCDAFGLPVLTLLDSPAALVPLHVDHPDAACALARAFGDATSGLVTVLVRRAQPAPGGPAGLPGAGADVTLAWPQVGPGAPAAALVVPPERTRAEVAAALALARSRRDLPGPRRHPVLPR
ncbi:MAG: carboxyl transferase domain-containing protein [Kineosporiaceae bacterium]